MRKLLRFWLSPFFAGFTAVFGWDDLIYLAASAAINAGAQKAMKGKGGPAGGQSPLDQPVGFIDPMVKQPQQPQLQPQQFQPLTFAPLLRRY